MKNIKLKKILAILTLFSAMTFGYCQDTPDAAEQAGTAAQSATQSQAAPATTQKMSDANDSGVVEVTIVSESTEVVATPDEQSTAQTGTSATQSTPDKCPAKCATQPDCKKSCPIMEMFCPSKKSQGSCCGDASKCCDKELKKKLHKKPNRNKRDMQ